ncbi:MAG: Sir2 silent information regulator family NAD-dependent deacetylase [Erysipelotrichaceae bacterium]|nr:Sir2 silent information regulator family NAD-dependent deacetylase [Erysipelotrichaceae bacterium]
MSTRISIVRSTKSFSESVEELKTALQECDAVVIGAGAGLSTSAGFIYTGERFEKYFSDFITKYGFQDMYSGGFYPFEKREEFWAYWSRYIYVNRYMDPPKDVYEKLYELVKGRDYFVITTNVDHCFQKAGFDRKRLFYTQGDYGLFQCSRPCHRKTYDNKESVVKMLMSQGFTIGEDGELIIPDTPLKMTVPSELIPVCPVCKEEMTMNLRSDDRFVEDEGWHEATERYSLFLNRHQGRILYLELGVGFNTPGIIKFPFWRMSERNPKAKYVCLNYDQACTIPEIEDRSICINADAGAVLAELLTSL